MFYLSIIPINTAPYAYALSLILSALIVLISIVPLAIARYPKGMTLRNVESPRLLSEELSRWGRRSEWAHKNTIETFTLHAPSTILAIIVSYEYNSPLPLMTITAALFHPLLRLFYIISYILNVPVLRAFFWGGSIGCTGIIYFESVKVLMYSQF